MISSDLKLSTFALVVSLITNLAIGLGAPYYLRRVRMERPAIGVFNPRDICVLFVLLATLPVFYLHLPRWLLLTFLTITFLSAISIGLRPLMSPARVWLTVGVLIGLNFWMGRNLLGTVLGWQLFWLETSGIVLLAAISVTNLYVQGGMKLKHVALFAAALGVYDVIFTAFWPLTNQLVQSFLGYPLDPSMGFRIGFDNAAVGVGDLLVYGLYVNAALKAYGPKAMRFALGLVVTFGAVLPSLAPLLINYVDARTDVLVPAQAWFGPPALLGYLWLRHRYGRERTVSEFWASPDFISRRRSGAATVPATAPAPVLEPITTP